MRFPVSPALALLCLLPYQQVFAQGTVWGWGTNLSGDLGNGMLTGTTAAPGQATGLTGVIAIAGGGDDGAAFGHGLALMSDGTVRAWGNNSSGQLGNGTICTTTPQCGIATAAQVTGLANVIAIAAGDGHSLALTSDGKVWAWGNNSLGQLGNGTVCTTTLPYCGVATPAQVSGLPNVIAIASGAEHNLALASDGTVWAWGENDYGELGNGTFTSCASPPCGLATPAQVSGLAGVTAIAGGGYHSLASNGTAWAWGYNVAGQLGNGTFNNSNVPVAVSSLTNVAAVAGGGYYSLALVNQTITVTVNTAPAGQSFTVDGTTYNNSQTFNWAPGSAHHLATSSPQGSGGTQYIFQSWSDGGAASHDVTASSATTTFTASFTKQDYLTTAAHRRTAMA